MGGKDGEGVGLGRFGKVFGLVVGLVKINIDRRIGNGLAGGQRGAVGVNFGGVESESGRKDGGANVGVIVARRRSGNTGRSGGTAAVVDGVEADFGGLGRDKGAVELKVAEVVGVSGEIEVVGFELDDGFGRSVTIQSKISLSDGG